MATHSSNLAWRIPRTEEPIYSPWGRKESDVTEGLTLALLLSSPQVVLVPGPLIWSKTAARWTSKTRQH